MMTSDVKACHRVSKTTISVFDLNKLARKERERLFAGLQDFANLADGQDAARAYGQQWPTFFPLKVQSPTGVDFSWRPESYGLIPWFRDMLRAVWRQDTNLDPSYALLLLGILPQQESISRQQARALSQDEWDFLFTAQKYAAELEALLGDPGRLEAGVWGIQFGLAKFSLDWRSGEFHYEPQTDFQRAVYLLFRESWRAKRCRQCSAYLIAQKPPQSYCSSRCYGDSKKQRGRRWWKKHGAAWRHGTEKGR